MINRVHILYIAAFFCLIISPFFSVAQEIPASTEQQLENQTDADQGETEDDSYLQELEQYLRHPMNLNIAAPEELKQLRIVSDLQIANLVSYRNLFGKFISIYELQAVPAWDILTIRKLLPFITVGQPLSLKEEAGKRFSGGDHILLLRVSQIIEKAKGYDKSSGDAKYQGSPQRVFFRYRYTYKNLLQYGLTADKDAGEQFFKGAQDKGFDFYSFHFFARKLGIVQSLAIGDFSVNMGQGLILWQGLAFKKSVEVMGIKRQSAVLRPYSSAAEFYFNRGVGVTIKTGKIESTLFVSLRKISGNFVADTVNHEDYISSFLTSGYHRTQSEIDDRNNLTQLSAGGNITYRGKNWHLGLNGVYYHFSKPVEKRNEPYNLYAVSGNEWYNMSVDYSFTHKNLHFFGEAAIDRQFSTAFVNGLLLSVDTRIDLSFLQRTIQSAYQAVNANTFAENTYPTNETGFFTGITIRPVNGWKLDAYADLFRFPWLKYLVDAPSKGTDYLVQLTHTPNKQVEIYTRFRNETKQSNQPDNNSVTNFLVSLPKQSWRTQVAYKLTRAVTLRNRIEMLWFDKNGENEENGFLTYFDFLYKPMLKSISGVLRLQYFETDGYNSRIYAYENDVMYSYTIPAFSDKGFRYYATLNYDLSKKLSCWVRWAQTIYKDKQSVGSGLDEIQGNRKTEVKVQVRAIF